MLPPSAAGLGALESRATCAHPRPGPDIPPCPQPATTRCALPAYLPGYLIQVDTCLLELVRTVCCDGPCTQVSQSSMSWPIYRRSRHRRGPTKNPPSLSGLSHRLTPPTPHPLHPTSFGPPFALLRYDVKARNQVHLLRWQSRVVNCRGCGRSIFGQARADARAIDVSVGRPIWHVEQIGICRQVASRSRRRECQWPHHTQFPSPHACRPVQSHCPSGPSGARPSYPVRLAPPACPALPSPPSLCLPTWGAHNHRPALPRYPVPCSRPCTHVPSQPCCAAPCNRRAQTQTFWDRQGPQTFHVQPTQSSIHFSTSHTFKSWTRRLPPIVPVLECLPKSVWCFALWVFSDHRPPPSSKAPEIPPSSHLRYLSPRPQSCSFCPDHPETRRLETPTHPPPSSDRHRAATHLRVCSGRPTRDFWTYISPHPPFPHPTSAASHKPTRPPKAHLQPGTLTQFLHTLGPRWSPCNSQPAAAQDRLPTKQPVSSRTKPAQKVGC